MTYAQQYTMPLQTNTYYAPSRPATSIGYAKPTTQSWQQPQYQYRMYQGDYMVQGQMRYIQGRGAQR